MDIPSSKRKIHTTPTPLMGGCALFITFFGLIWCHFLILHYFSESIGFIPQELSRHLNGALKQIPKLSVITLGGLILFSVGLIDDKWGLNAKTKFLFQIGVALLTALGGIQMTLFLHNSLFTFFLSSFWILLLINSFNLLDNMDGLSAGVGLIATLLFASVAVITGQYFLGIALALLAGTLAGFLIWNFNPAKIFMGDAGSQIVGYLIAVLTLLETFYTQNARTLYPVLMPLFILAVPLYDTASVILIRFKNGDSIFKADARHFSHRIQALGLRTKSTVLFLYLVTLALGLAAPVLPFVSPIGGICLLIQGGCTLSVIAILEYFGEKKLSNS